MWSKISTGDKAKICAYQPLLASFATADGIQNFLAASLWMLKEWPDIVINLGVTKIILKTISSDDRRECVACQHID